MRPREIDLRTPNGCRRYLQSFRIGLEDIAAMTDEEIVDCAHEVYYDIFHGKEMCGIVDTESDDRFN